MLLSVKNVSEARVAFSSDEVSILDVKNPSAGSLGFAGAVTINQIAAETKALRSAPASRFKSVSIALGELRDFDRRDVGEIDWSAIDFVKIGLSGFYKNEDWREPARLALGSIDPRVRRVLVLYVDEARPEIGNAMLNAAVADGFSVVLLDTYNKSNGCALDYWNAADCRTLFQSARLRKMTSVLAGSIGIAQLPEAKQTGADLIGVRGAVCDGDRANDLSPVRLNTFLEAYRDISLVTHPPRPVSHRSDSPDLGSR